MPADRSRIDAYLTEHLDHALGEIAELVAQPSVSAQGLGMAECAEVVARVLQRHGVDAQVYATAGNPVVVGRIEGRSPRTLLCYNHYDVQPAEPFDLWTSPPFEAQVRDGAIYGRGVRDDKGELVARLFALDAVRAAHGGELPCGVLFFVDGEEEIGSPSLVNFVETHLDLLRCDGAIWEEGYIDPDGAAVNILGCRGVMDVELSVQTLERDAHSGLAHLLPNAAWRLVRALGTLKDADEHILIPGFYDDVRPLSEADRALLAQEPPWEESLRGALGRSDFVLGRQGLARKEAVFAPTCNIQGITAGYQGEGGKTVIPARASAKLDFRLVPDQDPGDILSKLRAHLDAGGFADVAVRVFGGAIWPDRTPPDDPLVALTERTGLEVYGAARVQLMTGGSSPSYAFSRPLGIPTVTAGIGYWDNRAHSPDEHVRLPDFLNGARHIARILDGFGDL